MRRRVLFGLLVAVFVAGVAFWWIVLRGDVAKVASLPPLTSSVAFTIATAPPGTASGVTAVAVDGTSADGTWVVKPSADTFVGYRVDEQFAAGAVDKTAVGRSPSVNGTVLIAGATISSAKLQVDMTALKSDDTRRDAQIKVKGIETTKFPSATFELSSPITLPALPKLLDEIPAKAAGRLTLHGVTKDVTLDLTARWSGDRIDIAGHTDIVMADYGIDPPSIAGIVSVQNHGTLELQLMLTR